MRRDTIGRLASTTKPITAVGAMILKEELVGVLMTQRRPDRLALPPVTLDFWTSAYQLIEE